VFVRAGSKWLQQGPKLESGAGASVALSADGNTALLNEHTRQSLIYTRSGTTWSLASELNGGESEIGCGCLPSVPASVALSADGSTALVGYELDGQEWSAKGKGGTGAAWTFKRSGSSWMQDGPKLTANDEAGLSGFGSAVALSADGERALIGGLHDNVSAGAAWEFASPPAPVVSKLAPRKGSVAGGTTVTISGTGLSGATAVDFGATPASFTVGSDSSITATAPPGASGAVDVTVTTPGGVSTTSVKVRFTYKP
jgi:hypothetical protein